MKLCPDLSHDADGRLISKKGSPGADGESKLKRTHSWPDTLNRKLFLVEINVVPEYVIKRSDKKFKCDKNYFDISIRQL